MNSRVEDLVFLYLEEREEGLVRDYEDFARRHPSSDAAVRDRIEALTRAGLMNDEPQAAFPERLGNFRLLERLGGGGMGVVFLAEDTLLGRRVALKLIRPEQIYFGPAKERFRREVEAVAKLSHPGIVQVFSFDEDGGVPFFAMELVEGSSLGDVLQRFAGRSAVSLSGADLAQAVSARCGTECAEAPLFGGTWVRACLEIARQIAVALEHAHARGVVHRDIKPSNVMITPDGRARLLDFGLASRVGASRLTRTGAQLGSMPYMPPELISGRTEEAGPRTDVYSLGAMLHESLALSLPFQGDSTAQLALRITAGEHESVRRRNPDVSIDAETICNTAMEVDPARRYATAGALASDLANVLERRPIAARRTRPWIHARRWVERNPAGATAAVLGVLVLVGGPLGYGFLQAHAAAEQRTLNENLRSANTALATSLANEESERKRAGRNFDSAFEAVKFMLAAVGAEELREIPKLGPVRKSLIERALAFYARLDEDDPGNLAVHREQARVTGSLGDVLDDLARPDEALVAYEKAVELARKVFALDPDSSNTRQLFASVLMRLVRRQQQNGKLDLARAGYEEILPLAESLAAEEPENTRFTHDLAASLMNLGGFEMATGKGEQALLHRTRAVEVLRPAHARNPGDVALASQLVACLSALSNCESGDKGREDLREAWTLVCETMAAHPEVRAIRADLLDVSVNYGLELITHDPAEAERVLQKGMETGRRLVEEFPEDLSARHELCAVAINLGYHQTNQSRWTEAEQTLDEAVHQGETVVKSDGTRIEFRCTLATAIGCRSTARLGLGHIEEARADADRGVEIFAEVRKSLPRHPLVLAGSAACLMERADVECKTDGWRAALATTREALALGAQRSDIAFQAFETYWHIAEQAGRDPDLAGEERTRTVDELTVQSLDQLDGAIEQGFDDVHRLETLADYEGLRSRPRFVELVSKLASEAK